MHSPVAKLKAGKLTREDIVRFSSLVCRRNLKSRSQGIQMLKEYSGRSSHEPSVLYSWFHALQFLLAYPENQMIYSLALQEYRRITALICNHCQNRSRKFSDYFTGSEIPGTPMTASFSPTLVAWLMKKFPGQIIYDSVEPGEIPQNAISSGLGGEEIYLQDLQEMPFDQWLKVAAGNRKGDQLAFIIRTLEAMAVPDSVKDQLFATMGLYISFRPGIKTAKLFPVDLGNIFLHKKILSKEPPSVAWLKKRLPAGQRSSRSRCRKYIDLARLALMYMSRETDPVTYADPDNSRVVELERGLTVLLTGMERNRQLPLDSYIGFLVFKNGMPCAYGGAWIFGSHAKIGLNIFPAYRGGESRMIFMQLMRAYCQVFSVASFEIEPYQIGRKNPEAIISGAYWFYYRIGFRPMQQELIQFSDSEFKKISSRKNYRSPEGVLKKLAHARFVLSIGKNPGFPESADLSKCITKRIVRDFDGNRAAARKYWQDHVQKNVSVKGAKNILDHSPLIPLASIMMENNSGKKCRQKIVRWMMEKYTGDECAFIRTTQSFQQELNNVLKNNF